MEEKEKEFLYWLCQIPFLGAVSIGRLYDNFGSFRDIYNIEEKDIEAALGFKGRRKELFLEWKRRIEEFRREYASLASRGIRFITPWDREYPERLSHIYDRPMGLYARGRLPVDEEPSIAIVGARNCTSYGRQMGEYFAKVLSRNQVQVISGLASGIDSAAHVGALKAGGNTFGVLGCGVTICYPRENYKIFEAMEKQGGILSEFPLHEAPMPRNFPMRNRIISGLADGVLVVEAREKSGSLITADLALEQGREVFAVPGRATDPVSAGCNRLIKSGAAAVTSPEDLLEYLGLKKEKILRVHEKNRIVLAKQEKMVYSCLDLQPKFLEQVVKESGLSMGECMGVLLELELGGYIVQTTANYYVKKIER